MSLVGNLFKALVHHVVGAHLAFTAVLQQQKQGAPRPFVSPKAVEKARPILQDERVVLPSRRLWYHRQPWLLRDLVGSQVVTIWDQYERHSVNYLSTIGADNRVGPVT